MFDHFISGDVIYSKADVAGILCFRFTEDI